MIAFPFTKYMDFSVMWLFILPNVERNINDLKSIGPCAFYPAMRIRNLTSTEFKCVTFSKQSFILCKYWVFKDFIIMIELN